MSTGERTQACAADAEATTRLVSKLAVVDRLLDHAEMLIARETGSVVCWHEYTPEEALKSECYQCCVEMARGKVCAIRAELDPPTRGKRCECDDVGLSVDDECLYGDPCYDTRGERA